VEAGGGRFLGSGKRVGRLERRRGKREGEEIVARVAAERWAMFLAARMAAAARGRVGGGARRRLCACGSATCGRVDRTGTLVDQVIRSRPRLNQGVTKGSTRCVDEKTSPLAFF